MHERSESAHRARLAHIPPCTRVAVHTGLAHVWPEGLVAMTLGHACLRCDWRRDMDASGRNHNAVIATRWDCGVCGAIWMRLSTAVLSCPRLAMRSRQLIRHVVAGGGPQTQPRTESRRWRWPGGGFEREDHSVIGDAPDRRSWPPRLLRRVWEPSSLMAPTPACYTMKQLLSVVRLNAWQSVHQYHLIATPRVARWRCDAASASISVR
jgi:hypothetical protein